MRSPRAGTQALKRLGGLAWLISAAACGGSATAPSPFGPPLAAGIRSDQIQTAHQWVIGSPVPTQNQRQTYCCWPLPVLNAGSFRFDLSAFPLDLLPSGGQSNVVSASEMLFTGIDFSPSASDVQFDWHRAVGPDTVVFTYSSGPGQSCGRIHSSVISHGK
jgi:hypothetical protein